MNMNTLAALAESASKALEAEDLLAALRILTAGMAEVIGADAAAMLVTVEDPPALVTTVQRELGWGFTESFTERAFHAYHKACGEDMRSRTAVVVHGVPATDDGPETLTSFMSMPLYVNKRLLGLLALASEHPWHAIAEENMAVAGHIAGLLLQAYHRILESSSTDPLTGLFNRKRVQEELEFTASSMSRFGHPVSIVVIDIDNLKAVNETHDHLTGDQVLREMGAGPVAKILCLPALPPSGPERDRALILFKERGIDGVLLFRTMLLDLAAHVDVNKNYEKSDLLQMLRILKNYDLLKDAQMDLFRKKSPAKRQAKVVPPAPKEDGGAG